MKLHVIKKERSRVEERERKGERNAPERESEVKGERGREGKRGREKFSFQFEFLKFLKNSIKCRKQNAHNIIKSIFLINQYHKMLIKYLNL